MATKATTAKKAATPTAAATAAAKKATAATKTTAKKATAATKTTAKKATATTKSTSTMAGETVKATAQRATETVRSTTAKAASTAREVATAPISRAKEVGYTAVGLSVMGAQKLGQQGKAILDAAPFDVDMGAQIDQMKKQVLFVEGIVARRATKVDDAVEALAKRIETATEPFEAKLPEAARTQLTKFRTQATKLRHLVRTNVLEPAAKH